jgi:hypothetical protein
MGENAVSLVIFKDLLEDDAEEHFGILFDNRFILCFCCGGCLEPDDYEIIENFNGFDHLDEVLKQHY